MSNSLSTKTEALTEDQLKRAMPKSVRNRVTPDLVNDINGLMTDQQLRENFRDNLLSYASVMSDGKWKIQDYVNAVRYVSHKLLGSSNIEAYTKTFPDRFNRLVSEGADEKTISSYSTAYNKTALVNKIMEQTLVPTHVLNADIHQKAINRLASLMMTANSEKVQADAASSLLTHLKPPETSKIEVDVNVSKDKTMDELRNATLELVEQQKKMISGGMLNAKEVAHSGIVIEGKVEDGV